MTLRMPQPKTWHHKRCQQTLYFTNSTHQWEASVHGPLSRTPSPSADEPDRISRFTNLRAEPAKRYKEATLASVPTTSLYGSLLQQSRINGADHSIHVYSTSGFRQRREALEVAWGAHKYRLLTKANKHRFPSCSKCGRKLTHTHMLGGCPATQNARTRRHNST